MGIPSFSDGELKFGPFVGSPFAGVWTFFERFILGSLSSTLGDYQAKTAVNPASGSSVLINLISPADNVHFFQPAGGTEQFTPSPAFIVGHEYALFVTRPGTAGGDRLRVSLFDLTASTVYRATGTGTVSNPGTHAAGYIKIGHGDTSSYPYSGRIPVVAIWTGVALTTNAHELEALANHKSTDLLNHSVGRPSFLPDLDVAAVGDITDFGSWNLPLDSSSGVTFVSDPGDWDHDLGAAVDPPAATTAPSIVGTHFEGGTLTCDDGEWTGSPSFARQWRRGASSIAGETGATYVTAAADLGLNVSCRVTASNAGGDTVDDSNAIGPVLHAVPLPERYDEFVQVDDEWVRTAELGRAENAWAA